MKTQTIAFAALLLAACGQNVDRHQYWRERLTTHEAKYAKQPGANPRVVAFYDDPITLDTVSLDTQIVMIIERTDSFELLRYKERLVQLEKQRTDSIKAIRDWDRIVRLVDTGKFPNTEIMVRELVSLDSIAVEEVYGEFTLGARSSSGRDEDGHYWIAFSDSLGHVWRTTHFSDEDGLTILISAPDSLGDWQTIRLHCGVHEVYIPNHILELGYRITPVNSWQDINRFIVLATKQ